MISMSNLRPFLPGVLPRMHGYPKFGPSHQVKIAPKWGKSTERDPNLGEGEDTSVSQISEQPFQEMMKINRANQFWKWSGNISMSNFQVFYSECAENPPNWPASLSQIAPKMGQSNRPCPKPNQFCRWSGYNMPNFKPFCPWKVVPKWGKSTDSGQNLITSEGGQDTSACPISGHSFQVFSTECTES